MMIFISKTSSSFFNTLSTTKTFIFKQTMSIATTTTDKSSNEQPAILKWASKDGEFRRQQSIFRDIIEDNPNAKFAAERDRYHLYISWACPWAHRTAIVRNLKGLDSFIGLSVVDFLMLDQGWKFSTAEECPGAIPDTINNASYLRDLYLMVNPNYQGRFTVPVLWDKKLKTIVNNESSEIIRIFNTAFNRFLSKEKAELNYYPEHLQKEIDENNEWIYDTINNGVYKSGFATTQDAYENHVYPLFKSLDRVEKMLEGKKYLVQDTFTEADIRLFTTIVRFDPVYFGHFKCNLGSIEHNYPNILKWTRRIYQKPGVKETVHMDHIKKHYYMSHRHINPTQVVPVNNGPDLDIPVEP
ncbi:glutathione S-transferase [Cokeromyces recurvatus]|uniref:glutathione S-transferase n=1 Tax=Cokeromyces recurvatus TaxID=90255 RepID=UPI002220A15B|nr:glutathione S-transferase [Cokeromyces recurvatus]KAI7902675.1 glutathione S-transferase [Cokeromyces recurvatus]